MKVNFSKYKNKPTAKMLRFAREIAEYLGHDDTYEKLDTMSFEEVSSYINRYKHKLGLWGNVFMND